MGLNRLYDKPALQRPEKMAIYDGKIAYTFKQLQQGTAGFASILTDKYIHKGDRVIVVALKCSEMGIIAPAIWKAGAVYVPVDPANPGARMQLLFESVRPALLVVPDDYTIPFPLPEAGLPVITYSQAVSYISYTPASEIVFPEIEGSDLAYIMHTSGSTGKPKGVMIEHDSVIDYFYNHNQVLQFSETSYCLSLAPFYFDVSIEDTFLPLSLGACVYQYRGLPVAPLILSILVKQKITHFIAVSTILTLVTGDGKALADALPTSLEMVMTGAEVCDPKVISIWKELLPHVRVYNVYGPTETTIVCTAYEVERPDKLRGRFFPIGKPLVNVKALIVDERGAVLTDPGQKGELLIGGKQVMRGYWNDPALTARVLVQIDGETYYRTGDKCYFDENADLVFCGRNDEEIKLFGRRIHLMDIKTNLLQNNHISTVCAGIVNTKGRPRLAVIICSEKIQTRDGLESIGKWLAQQLPAYMVPEFLGLVADPVMSPSGKNDERRMLGLLESAIALYADNYYELCDGISFAPLKRNGIHE